MKIAVLIPTHGRKAILTRLLAHLERQTRQPDLVLVSAIHPDQVEPLPSTTFKCASAFGKQGSSPQRNLAIDKTISEYDVVVFFDDDFLPARDYLAVLEAAFTSNANWAALTGEVIRDGVCGQGIDFGEGVRLLDEDWSEVPRVSRPVEVLATYGCNMAFRCSSIGDLRFDERLPLYAWQEDVDFSTQIARRGRVIRLNTLRGVHLGIKSGRVSGVRFGYSQIVNPLYLMRKGTLPIAKGIGLMARNVTSNVMRSLWPESYIDRRGRLRGNLLAAYHVLQRRIEPEHVLNL